MQLILRFSLQFFTKNKQTNKWLWNTITVFFNLLLLLFDQWVIFLNDLKNRISDSCLNGAGFITAVKVNFSPCNVWTFPDCTSWMRSSFRMKHSNKSMQLPAVIKSSNNAYERWSSPGNKKKNAIPGRSHAKKNKLEHWEG